MKALKMLLVSFVILGLTACATGPKFSEMSSTIGQIKPDKGRVYIYRKTALGAAIQPKVKLNGKEIGKAVPKGFFYVDLAPGQYVIETSTEVDRRLSFELEKGQTKYVRLNISMGFFAGHVYPELVESSVGEKEIQDCGYIGEKN
jgi:hypothetical protein